MSDQASQNIRREEQRATKATADENAKEIRKEAGKLDDNDEEIVTSTSKPERSLASSTLNSNDNVEKEAPEMNIQLQR